MQSSPISSDFVEGATDAGIEINVEDLCQQAEKAREEGNISVAVERVALALRVCVSRVPDELVRSVFMEGLKLDPLDRRQRRVVSRELEVIARRVAAITPSHAKPPIITALRRMARDGLVHRYFMD